jgi:hypothetical protein
MWHMKRRGRQSVERDVTALAKAPADPDLEALARYMVAQTKPESERPINRVMADLD